MFALLYDPVGEIRRAKTQNFFRIISFLIAASLFEAVGIFFISWRYVSHLMPAQALVSTSLVIFLALVVAHLVVALYFSIVMHVLDGKGGYYEGLATLVLAMVAPAVSLFFGGALTFISAWAAIPVVLYGYVLGAATLFRAGKELFELDYAGVLAGFLITFVTVGLAVCGFLFL